MCIWYKHNLGFLRIVSPVMVTFQKKILQNISLIIKFVKINPLWLHSFIPSRQNLNKIKLLSLNVGHDLS